MTALGDGRYTATVPGNQNAELKVSKVCGVVAQEESIGQIELFDPSGYITDAATGAPVPGAKVTLYVVPGWRARVGAGDVAPHTCQSNRNPPMSCGVNLHLPTWG